MKLAVALIVLLGLSNQSPAKGIAVEGVGSKYCSEVARGDPPEDSVQGILIFSWAQGYMSALNVSKIKEAYAKSNGKDTTHSDSRNLAGMTQGGQYALILDYCRKHPSDTLYLSVESLYFDLPPSLP